MKQTHEAIICLAGGISQLPLIETAKKRGYDVIVVDRNPDAPGLKLADYKIIESTYDTPRVLSELHALKKQYHFCGLLARTSGPALGTAASISEEFDLPGLSRDIIPLATEKSKLREFCEDHGISMPKGQRISCLNDLDPDFPIPLIVKPDLPLIGKKDVRVVWEKENLSASVLAAIQSSGNGFAEVEEYIDGIDASTLFLMKHGHVAIINYWDELIGITAESRIKAVGVSTPSVIEGTDTSEKLRKESENISQYFKGINAFIILSFRIDFSGNAYLIEMHCDLGGDLIADILLPAAYKDFDFFNMALNASMNSNIYEKYKDIKSTCLIYDLHQYNVALPKSTVICDDIFYIQEGDLHENFKQLSLLIENAKMGFKRLPHHQNWLKTKKRKEQN